MLWRVLSCGMLLAAAAGAAGAERPSGAWRTIETPHFRVHFPAAFERWASRAASSLEGVFPRVSEYVGYEPPRRIDVVISDPAADSNGIAYPYLDRPRIELWASPPDPDSGLGEFRDWTELLVTHEFAHIVHLTRPRNRPGIVERLLPVPIGPVFRNSPRWVAEGYATLVEGALTGSGRPGSGYRAMVLRQFAIEGKLPSYRGMNGTSGWLGGSMAYLVGSSFLEWLEANEGAGSLRKLWKRMASRRGGGFGAAFRGVFGRPPSDLYDRFRAETTARAVEQERELRSAGLVEGEKWQELEGATASPQVSPDGRRLVAWRSPRRGESHLAVWTLAPTAKEIEARENRAAREQALLSDPNEVAEKRVSPEPRPPRWKLSRLNGRSPEDPRWMPDGRRILFGRREPSADGALHRDLFLWEPESGWIARVTRLADVSDPDPLPDGTAAVAVRNRFGVSELVRVDLASGRVEPLTLPPAADAWQVWSHPRLSPDGASIAALVHREGRWRLAVLPVATGGAMREVPSPGDVFGAPAWSRDGRTLYIASGASGIWEIVSAGVQTGESVTLTRVTGGAFSAAPEPDGRGLFFLELTAKGIDVRRIDLPVSAPPVAVPSILPKASTESRPISLSPVAAPSPYRAGSTSIVRLFSSFTGGPDGASYLVGAQGGDVIGRLDWVVAGAFGNGAGPRGGTAALRWSGLPVDLSLQLFSALERPGSQRLVSRPELDSERRGAALSASWQAVLPSGRIRGEASLGAARLEALDARETFGRVTGGVRAQGEWRRFRGKSGISIGAAGGGSAGRTGGSSWMAGWGGLRLSASASGATLSVDARAGATGGSPTRFDLFAVGGAPTSLLPAGPDANRIDSPALPFAVQSGSRFEGGRLQVSATGSPLLFYAERWRAWSSAGGRPAPVRLEGLEVRLDSLIPLDLPDSLSFYAGAARVRSREPRFDSIRGYAGLIYRP
ncbi:MAG: hypothetical protein LC796_03830 [Acidobacteria bacterium]|nr:hypothetical protein [Acidobacteriota bacterium]